MGIEKLYPLLEKHCPESMVYMRIDFFRNKRIAIDANHWLYTALAVARKNVIDATNFFSEDLNKTKVRALWAKRLIDFVLLFLKEDILPVFVVDGHHLPEKSEKKKKLKEQREKQLLRIEELKNVIRNGEEISVGSQILELKKLLKVLTIPETADYDQLQFIVESLGLPFLKAENEGELLCSYLCLTEKVAAVYSTDSDCLAAGCPLLIKGITVDHDSDGQMFFKFDCIIMRRILRKLELTQNEFTDLCILLGCDFNKKYPGKGPGKLLTMVKEKKEIEDFDCLKFQRCREIFSQKFETNNYSLEIKKQEFSEILEKLEHVNVIADNLFLVLKGVSEDHSDTSYKRILYKK